MPNICTQHGTGNRMGPYFCLLRVKFDKLGSGPGNVIYTHKLMLLHENPGIHLGVGSIFISVSLQNVFDGIIKAWKCSLMYKVFSSPGPNLMIVSLSFTDQSPLSSLFCLRVGTTTSFALCITTWGDALSHIEDSTIAFQTSDWIHGFDACLHGRIRIGHDSFKVTNNTILH